MKSNELQTPYSVQNLHEYPVIPDNNNNQGHYLEHQAGYPSKSVEGSNVNYYPAIWFFVINIIYCIVIVLVKKIW